MNMKLIQKEIDKIQTSPFSKKTDKQLISYEILSQLHKKKYQGIQPLELVKYNNSDNRLTTLTKEKVQEIRIKYNPHVYGKNRLASEYGVSVSLIYKIIKRNIWKNV